MSGPIDMPWWPWKVEKPMSDIPMRERSSLGQWLDGAREPFGEQETTAFEGFYIPEPNSGCWLWLGSVSGGGYGQFWSGGQRVMAHRWAYEKFVGPIAAGMVIDHLCRNTLCANPDHLEVVSHRENCLRGVSPLAKHAAQTHCKRGHPLAGDNVFSQKGRPNSRFCKKCAKVRSQKSTVSRTERRNLRRAQHILNES